MTPDDAGRGENHHTPPDDELDARLRRENHLLRWRYDVVAYHADLHAHAAQQALRERDEALAALARAEQALAAATGSRRWRRRAAGEPATQATELTATEPNEASTPREAALPVVIISRDRFDCLRQLVSWLESTPGVGEIHIVDNASTWPPLVEYLDASPHTVHRLGVNLGHHAPWITGLISEISQGPFVVTDPDVIPDPDCPHDVLAHFRAILDRHPGIDKVGFGLRIDDLPDSFAHRDAVVRWESRFWTDAVEPGVYRAEIDTTFAVYRPGRDHKGFNALRTGPPYVARHLPWYAPTASPTAEEIYYREHADPAIASWTGDELPLLYQQREPDQRAAEAQGSA